MTNRRNWSANKRKAYNKKKRSQRMRKVKRYARAFARFEYYMSGYFNEVLLPHAVMRKGETEIRFVFHKKMPHRIDYAFLELLHNALNLRFESYRVQIHCGWALGNQWVCRATTSPRQNDVRTFCATDDDARLATALKV
jgi:hypothetical protein